MTVLLEGVYAEYRAHLASRGLAPPVGLKVEVCGPPLVRRTTAVAEDSCTRWGIGQTLEGSFSAVSAPIFARKYAFCSIFQIYQILKLKFLKFDKICKFCDICNFLLKFHENCCFFKPIFCENFEIAELCKEMRCVDLGESFETHM